MAASPQTDINNLLLRSVASLPSFARNLEEIELRHGTVLFDVDETVRYVTFPARASMVSMIAMNETGELTEVGVIGAEGAVGVNLVLDSTSASYRALVQVPGHGWR